MGTHMKLFTIFASAVLANQEKRQVPDQFAGYLSLAENFLGNGQYQSIYNSVLSELATNTYWQDWVPTVPTDITALSNLPTGFESELESVSEFLATADRTGDSSITRATQTTTRDDSSSTTTSSSTTSSSSDDSSSAAAPMLDAYFTSLIASFLGLSAGMVMMF